MLTATDDDLRRRWGALSSRALTCLDAGMVTEAEDNDRLAGAIADELMVPGAQCRARFVEARDLTASATSDRPSSERSRRCESGAPPAKTRQQYSQPRSTSSAGTKDTCTRSHSTLMPSRSRRHLTSAFACHASAQLGRREDAHRLLVGLAARGFADVAFDGYWLTILALAADVAVHLGDEAIMSELYDMLLPWKDQCAATAATFLGAMTHPLAQLAARLGSRVDADAAFREASASHARHDAPILDARLHLEWGRFLAQRDAPRARTHLTRASRAADRLGAGGIAIEAKQMLRALAAPVIPARGRALCGSALSDRPAILDANANGWRSLQRRRCHDRDLIGDAYAPLRRCVRESGRVADCVHVIDETFADVEQQNDDDLSVQRYEDGRLIVDERRYERGVRVGSDVADDAPRDVRGTVRGRSRRGDDAARCAIARHVGIQHFHEGA